MKYVGIDLGTTNSAICSYDGESVRLYKSPEQNDVTPSAIFIDRRGNKYLGKRAYDSAAKNPDNAATKFKRMMGTSTPVKMAAVNITMTPEECSAEILKLCFGYLPEELRNGGETGTVITVPAAFNQMQKDATLAAAEMAGLGSVALMQEPVAAVMCVMKQRKGDGVFVVFDLGGGTLDIAIADGITSVGLVDYIKSKGGIDKVRKAVVSAETAREQAQGQKALETALKKHLANSAQSIATVVSPNQPFARFPCASDVAFYHLLCNFNLKTKQYEIVAAMYPSSAFESQAMDNYLFMLGVAASSDTNEFYELCKQNGLNMDIILRWMRANNIADAESARVISKALGKGAATSQTPTKLKLAA